jgi:hypothetical protein
MHICICLRTGIRTEREECSCNHLAWIRLIYSMLRTANFLAIKEVRSMHVLLILRKHTWKLVA